MLVTVGAVLACLAGISLTLLYAASDLRRRAGATDEEGHDGDATEKLSLKPAEKKWKPRKQSAESAFLSIIAAFAIFSALAGLLALLLWQYGQEPPRLKCVPPGAEERIAMFGPMHGFSHPTSTSSSTAQKLFNQGMLLASGFNQPESLAAFSLAAHEDPTSAMAEWGIAYAQGPGANRETVTEPKPYPSFNPQDFPACQEHAQKALHLAVQALKDAATSGPGQQELLQKELAYAEAQVARFANGTAMEPERAVAQQRYAELMEGIGERYQDVQAKALAAEGYMTVKQWNYYDEKGQLWPEAERAERLIMETLQQDPKNPLAHHLHIHVSETAQQSLIADSLTPKRAEGSGVMMTFEGGPWDDHVGHLLHMPGHIHIRNGRWKDAVTANIRAYKADMELTKHCMVAYGPEHNTDMLIYAAQMAGMTAKAEEFGGKLREYQELMFPAAYGENTREWTHLVLTKVMFAKWDDILAIREVPETARGQCPSGGLPYATAMYHYARALALAAKAEGAAQRGATGESQRLKGLAETSLALLREAEGKIPEEEPTVPGPPPGIYGCDYQTLARIAVLHAEARMALLSRNTKVAVAKLEEAKGVEDGMAYNEPPRLYQPIRHCLGYVLSNVTGEHSQAEQAYREDLLELPKNGWSLLGLGQSLRAQGSSGADDVLLGQFPAVWKDADTVIETSCLAFSQL